MTCQELLEFLMMYLDGELPPEQKTFFEKHLGDCPACVDYLSTYQKTIRLGRDACAEENPCKDVPEELVRAILAARRAK